MKIDLKMTPSRVRDYLVCPRRFEQLYNLGPSKSGSAPKRPTANPALSLGSSVHAALDALHKPGQVGLAVPANIPDAGESGALNVEGLTEEAITELVERHWQSEGYSDKAQSDAAFQNACSMLKFYTQSPHVPSGAVLATEAFLTCVTSLRGYTVELSCRVDRIELLADGTLQLLDYKVLTNGEVPTPQAMAEDLASFIYFLLAWHYYRRDARVHNVRLAQLNMVTLARVDVQYDQGQIVRHRDALGDLVVAVMRGSLQPHVSAGCAWCQVQEGCPAWSSLDLADLDMFDAWRGRDSA